MCLRPHNLHGGDDSVVNNTGARIFMEDSYIDMGSASAYGSNSFLNNGKIFVDGKYNVTDGFGQHAAIYLFHSDDGIEVLDQWNRQGEVKQRTIRTGQSVTRKRSNRAECFFGRYEYRLRYEGEAWLIARKKIVLKDDYIRQVIDVYHV